MAVVYNKEQMDAIARKIGLSIKAQFAKLGTAAFKNIGLAVGQIPLVDNVYKVAFSGRDNYYPPTASNIDANNFELGSRNLVYSSHLNMPPVVDYYFVETVYNYSESTKLQKASGYYKTSMFVRSLNGAGVWLPWRETVLTGTAPEFVSIKIGPASPTIAYKKLTGTFKAGTNTLIPHGLAVGKILSVDVSVLRSSSTTVPPNNPSAGLNYTYYWTNNDITLRDIDASVLTGAPVIVLITYEV